MTAPMTSRKALQDALDEWARANLPTESAGCITSWSDWIAAFVCDGVFGDSQMHPLSDIRDLDEAVRELGIQDSSTTPAEAVRELNAEIERLRSVAQAPAWQPIETVPMDGNPIIVWDDPVMGEAYYDIGEKSLWWANTGPGDYTAEAIYPTLWRPMPTPPSPVSSTHEGGK